MITEFALNLSEKKRLQKWLKVHKDHCAEVDITICFAPGGGIGTSVYARCACGRKKELTDYGSW